MPKPTLNKESQALEGEIIATLLKGLHRWRPDLSYPESHSDMSGAVRELMAMYEIKRKPEPLTDEEIRQRIADNYFDEEYD